VSVKRTNLSHSRQLFNTLIPTVAGGRSLTLCWFGHTWMHPWWSYRPVIPLQTQRWR